MTEHTMQQLHVLLMQCMHFLVLLVRPGHDSQSSTMHMPNGHRSWQGAAAVTLA
jgi:hypothetical protein